VHSSIEFPTIDSARDQKRNHTESIIADDLSSRGTTSSVKSKPDAVCVPGSLAALLERFPDDLAFEQDNKEEPAPLRSLPDELLVLILCKLDPTTIERFAAVSRKARVLSLDSAIWR
jgi:F-box protein 9